MDEFSAAEAAKYLGVTREAVDAAARDGRLSAVAGDGPRRFSREAVEEYHHLRQAEKIAKLARGGETPVSVARRVRTSLHSVSDTGLPRSYASKLAVMPEPWRSLFNKAELAAAAVPDGECRWCKAAEFTAFLELRPLEYAPARVELFGAQPCQVCRPGLLRPFMAALSAQVHPGRHRPPDARAEAAAAVPPAPRPRPAQPFVGDDDGKALVAHRLRQTRERLKAAKRAGDEKYAIRLQQTLRALTADASAIDGLVAAAARRSSSRGQR